MLQSRDREGAVTKPAASQFTLLVATAYRATSSRSAAGRIRYSLTAVFRLINHPCQLLCDSFQPGLSLGGGFPPKRPGVPCRKRKTPGSTPAPFHSTLRPDDFQKGLSVLDGHSYSPAIFGAGARSGPPRSPTVWMPRLVRERRKPRTRPKLEEHQYRSAVYLLVHTCSRGSQRASRAGGNIPRS